MDSVNQGFNQKMLEDLTISDMSEDLTATSCPGVLERTTQVASQAMLKISGKRLGSGTQATVFECTLNEVPCAVKVFRASIDASGEYETLKLFDHPNIIRSLGVEKKALILPLAKHGSLASYWEKVINQQIKLTYTDIKKILHQICFGLAHIHLSDYVHRDIKLENVLVLDDNNSIVIVDFGGLVKKEAFDSGEFHGTIFYTAPEMFDSKRFIQRYYQKSDVWSFGILVWKLLHKEEIQHPCFTEPLKGFACVLHIVEGSNAITKEKLITQLDPKKVKAFDPEGLLLNIIHDCLRPDPKERPEMIEIYSLLSDT